MAFCHDSCRAVDELAIWRCGEEGNLFLYGSLRAARVCFLLLAGFDCLGGVRGATHSISVPLRQFFGARLDETGSRPALILESEEDDADALLDVAVEQPNALIRVLRRSLCSLLVMASNGTSPELRRKAIRLWPSLALRACLPTPQPIIALLWRHSAGDGQLEPSCRKAPPLLR